MVTLLYSCKWGTLFWSVVNSLEKVRCCCVLPWRLARLDQSSTASRAHCSPCGGSHCPWPLVTVELCSLIFLCGSLFFHGHFLSCLSCPLMNTRGDLLQVLGILSLCCSLLSDTLQTSVNLVSSDSHFMSSIQEWARLCLGSSFLHHGLETLKTVSWVKQDSHCSQLAEITALPWSDV
jgi:hypothetical protein